MLRGRSPREVGGNLWGEVIQNEIPEGKSIVPLYQDMVIANPAFERTYHGARYTDDMRKIVFDRLSHEYDEMIEALQSTRSRFFVRFRPDGYECSEVQVQRSRASQYNRYQDLPLDP